ncbi:MAG: 3-deoxy-D-manno-octulosonic acid transferase [Burkholderiales bacterium]|nr:3-deoxy-D-manno-octulosonic acid transferase [Burkholderiales bacterium]
MRKFYSLLTYVIAPLIPLYLKKRGKKNSAYLENWHERFGCKLHNPSTKPIIWLHSVSVGETRAMQKLVELIETNLPNYQTLITNMTPTGRDTAKSLYPQAIVHYVPYDISFCVKSFYKTFKPKIGIIMETEIWPNLIHFAADYRVPLYLANARLSDRSYRGYNRFKWALMPIINKFSGILCQDENTANNFKKLSYLGDLSIIGNTKFDLVVNNDTVQLVELFKKLFGSRRVITFASTRDGEEELILNNIDLDLDVCYLIIPRHPERFSVLENLLKSKNISYQKRSSNQQIENTTKVVIGDSMGEMLAYYAISYLTVIGGSFTDCGGQNPIEAIFMNIPVIFGQSMFNFADVAKNSTQIGCARQIKISELKQCVNDLACNVEEYNKLKSNCNEFISKYQGSSEKVFSVIKQKLL